jgi:hypothetical protein
VASSFFGQNAVAWELGAQTVDDELLRCAIGFGYQIEGALQLEADVALKKAVEQNSGFARDLRRAVEE